MENSVNQLQSHFQAQPVPPPPQNTNFQELAAEQVRQLGPSMDPALSQLATVMATMQLKADHDAKLSSHLLQKALLETVNNVKQNNQEISELKSSLTRSDHACVQLQQQQGQAFSQLGQVYETSVTSYNLAAETKQKCSKGNFIVSGEGVPRISENENLYTLIFPLIYRKYGINVHPSELKALHRLPNNKILFSLYSRMPGRAFDQLVRAMNSNPKPEVKVYVSIQLFEPFAELYYIARRLKYYKYISNYRLDENGNTQIALQIDTMSFKFTGLDQLKALNISVPAQIYQEVAYRRNQIKENEARSAAMNNEKAFKKRPNFVPDFNKTQQSSYTAGYTQNQQISVQAQVQNVPKQQHSPPQNSMDTLDQQSQNPVVPAQNSNPTMTTGQPPTVNQPTSGAWSQGPSNFIQQQSTPYQAATIPQNQPRGQYQYSYPPPPCSDQQGLPPGSGWQAGVRDRRDDPGAEQFRHENYSFYKQHSSGGFQ